MVHGHLAILEQARILITALLQKSKYDYATKTKLSHSDKKSALGDSEHASRPAPHFCHVPSHFSDSLLPSLSK